MLREVGRHAKQALLVPGKRHERVSILSVPPPSLHSSCALSGLHALALTKHNTPHTSQGTPVAHVYPMPPLTRSEARSSLPPISRTAYPRTPPCPRGQLPSGIIDTIDAFSSATKEEIIIILSDINISFSLRRYFRQRETARRLAQFLASTSRPSRAHSVMSLAYALGCRFKPNHFESVLYQLSLKEHWSLIPPFVSLARDQCGRTTTRLLNWKIRALIECHHFARLDHVIEEFARDNVQPTRRTFHLLVSGHLRNQDLDSAKRYLELMEKAGFPIDASTHALIVIAYRSLGLDSQVHARALDALHLVDARTSTRVLNSTIQHFLDVGDECSAAELFDRMIGPLSRETDHHPRDTTTGADGALSSVISSSPPSGSIPVIHPDAATFTILINYLNSQKRFHRIHKVVNHMVEIGIRPDTGVVAALIRTYCLSGRDDLAMSLLAAMLESNANARNVLALLRAKRVPSLPIDVKGIGLTIHVFNAILPRVMEICGLNGARHFIRIMRSEGVRPNATTVELFLNHLGRMKHIETRQLVQVLRSTSRKGYGPTIRHLNILLCNALRREKHRVHGTGWDTTAANLSPTRRMPSFSDDRHILTSEDFDPSSHHPHSDSCVRSTILALSRNGVKNDRATFVMWLKHEGITDPTLSTVNSVFRHMVDKGMHPNRHHFVSLMDGFARAGNMRAAEQVMRSAKVAGFEPDVVMWTVLISGHGRKGEPRSAMRAFRTMVATGIAPDIPAIDALAHAYFAVGAYSVARKVLLELWPRVKPFPNELKNAPLKQLARAFRRLGDPTMTYRESLTLQKQRSFNRKLRQVLEEWKEV